MRVFEAQTRKNQKQFVLTDVTVWEQKINQTAKIGSLGFKIVVVLRNSDSRIKLSGLDWFMPVRRHIERQGLCECPWVLTGEEFFLSPKQ